MGCKYLNDGNNISHKILLRKPTKTGLFEDPKGVGSLKLMWTLGKLVLKIPVG
jgi:hypothetical protein